MHKANVPQNRPHMTAQMSPDWNEKTGKRTKRALETAAAGGGGVVVVVVAVVVIVRLQVVVVLVVVVAKMT